jgi:uracil-DNA glycosylase
VANDQLDELCATVVKCRRCPRLVAWREQVATERRAAYSGEQYWGRPIPGFGDHSARLAVVGLAPAAHGGNRTGRIFTGDRSGDWLWAALWRAGLASQPQSVSRDDGLRAIGVWVTATVKCAPPQNRPTPQERDTCRPYLERELELLPGVRVLLALGGFAYEACCRLLGVRRRPPFGHGVEVRAGGDRTIVCSYHPSQQNTFTGKLTEVMLDTVIARAWELAGGTANDDRAGDGPDGPASGNLARSELKRRESTGD